MLSCWKYQQVPVCRSKKTFARGDFSSTCFVFIQSCIITLITVDAWYICCKRADSSHNRRIVRTFLRFIALHGTVVQLLKWEVKQFFCHCFYHSIPSISSRKSITLSWAGWVHCNTHKGRSGYCVEPPKRVFQSLWGCMTSIAPPWTTLVFTMMPCCLFTMSVNSWILTTISHIVLDSKHQYQFKPKRTYLQSHYGNGGFGNVYLLAGQH